MATGTELTLYDRVQKANGFIAKILPDATPTAVERFTREVKLYFDKADPKLNNTSMTSRLQSVMFAAQLGLAPGYGNKIHFVAFGNTCVPIIGYNGYLELAERSGEVSGVEARLVYEADIFEIDYAKNPQYSHKPYIKGDRGTLLGAYAVIHRTSGRDKFEYMTKDEIDKIRDASPTHGKVGPWTTHYGEMCKKTVIRRAFKTEIISPLVEKAVELDNRVDSGKSIRNLIDLAPGEYEEIEDPAPPPALPEINQTQARAAKPPTERPGRGKPHKEQPQQQQEFIDPITEIVNKINNGRKELISAFPGEDVWSEICDGQGIPTDADLTKVDYSVLEAIERAVQGSMK